MMIYKKNTKIAVLMIAVLVVVITGSAFTFGSQGIIGFAFWKPSYYEVAFPYERISDLSAADMKALILEEINSPKAEIYIHTQWVRLNTDYTLDDYTTEVLISEYDESGAIIYRPYQILITSDRKSMIINPQNYTLPTDTDYRHCTFESNWNALSLLPIDAIGKTILRNSPDQYLLQYTPNDWYNHSSPQIQHIFYDIDGILDSYTDSPSVLFNFWPTYQDNDDANSLTSDGTTTILYYYER